MQTTCHHVHTNTKYICVKVWTLFIHFRSHYLIRSKCFFFLFLFTLSVWSTVIGCMYLGIMYFIRKYNIMHNDEKIDSSKFLASSNNNTTTNCLTFFAVNHYSQWIHNFSYGKVSKSKQIIFILTHNFHTF